MRSELATPDFLFEDYLVLSSYPFPPLHRNGFISKKKGPVGEGSPFHSQPNGMGDASGDPGSDMSEFISMAESGLCM